MSFNIPKGTSKVPFSIRVDEGDFEIIDKLHNKTDKSYNYIVNLMIKYAIENMAKEDLESLKIEDKQENW